MASGSVFAGWMMHRMGRYKAISLILGIFPFIGAVLISTMREDAGPLQSWLSIVRLRHIPLSVVDRRTRRFRSASGTLPFSRQISVCASCLHYQHYFDWTSLQSLYWQIFQVGGYLFKPG
jgi:hypothetical protein